MKKSLPLFAVVIVLLFVTCDRDWDNPFHDNNTLDPEAWAPENFEIETISISELKLTWDYQEYNIEGFKLDRKRGDEEWQVAHQVFRKEVRNWYDVDIDSGFIYRYRIYAFAGANSSSKIEDYCNPNVQIGEIYKGGIVFFLDGNGGGLLCAKSDQSTGAKWGCKGTSIFGTSTSLGSGAANTTKIVVVCNQSGIAGKICKDLVLNGYDDWFLPSKDELNLMYQNLKVNGIGGFASAWYWSSSEYISTLAWIQSLNNGYQGYNDKHYNYHVRAVRAF